MLLAIDIGNTNTVFGIFDGERMAGSWRFYTDVHKMPDEFGALLLNLLPHRKIDPAQIDSVIISSVVPPLTATYEETCRQYFNITALVVEPGIRTGVRIEVDNPREVGADRIVNAAAAHKLYDGALIVIDFGTATTFDAVSAGGDYLGGAIAPGIEIAMEALSLRTAKLPRVELQFPKTAIGKNTVHAMQSGVLFGYIGLIEGVVTRLKAELGGSVTVVATGGLARIVGQRSPVIDKVNPNLTLEGLRLIYELNRSR